MHLRIFSGWRGVEVGGAEAIIAVTSCRAGIADAGLYRWKKDALRQAGPAARSLGDRVAQLEDELRRVERERDILKKALSILSRSV